MSVPPAEHQALLRRFEPILRYTRGEQFFPIEVSGYVDHCSLWVERPQRRPTCLVPHGELTLERLAQPYTDDFGAIYYLRFLSDEALDDPITLRQQAKLDRQASGFHAGPGRLARVGYLSRFGDALFSISLLARGRLPGDAAAAAGIAYREIVRHQPDHCYYGRVVRVNQWVVLQYWFFYPFNHWRTGFFGANDHEADWEMISLYLSETEGGDLQPEWVAYASHDFSGDDLRRRWDDPEVVKVGEHPVVYVGAGSHASYFAPGEYLAEIEIPILSRVEQRLQRLRRLLRLGSAEAGGSPLFSFFRVPFVDYARGDGFIIGPGGDRPWGEPQLIEPPPEWAANYRGLWGFYARDPLAGENAPAGPLYNRDGSTRRAWYDPLGWAGVDKLLPWRETFQATAEHQAAVRARLETVRAQIETTSQLLTNLGLEAAAMYGLPHLAAHYQARTAQIAVVSETLNTLRAQLVADENLLGAMDHYLDHLHAGERGPLRAHIRRAHPPSSESELRLSRFAEIWSAISIGLLLVGVVAIVFLAPRYLIFGLVALVAIIGFVEAGARQQLPRLISSVTNALAIVSALILIWAFFWQTVVLVIFIAGAYIMQENLRELRA